MTSAFTATRAAKPVLHRRKPLFIDIRNQFYAEIEQWMFQQYTGSYAAIHVEWSKGWAYTKDAGWANSTMLDSIIPNTLRAGQASNDNWDTAVAMLDYYDPFRLFSSPLTDRLMP